MFEKETEITIKFRYKLKFENVPLGCYKLEIFCDGRPYNNELVHVKFPGGDTHWNGHFRKSINNISICLDHHLGSNKLPVDFNFKAFAKYIDKNTELSGARILYYNGNNLHVVREGQPVCGPTDKTIIIKPGYNSPSGSNAQDRESRMYSEVTSGALSCTAAIISWLVVSGSGAAAPFSGGTSTVITVLASSAAVASTAQCGNSMVRIYNESFAPESNDWLDSQNWYVQTGIALDAISLAGATAAGAYTIKMAFILRTNTGKSMTAVLKGLSRQERRRITEEIIRVENPGISNSALKTFIASGRYPKRISNLQLSGAISQQLKAAAGAATSYTGSFAGGIAGSSGKYVIGIAQSLEIY